MVILDRIRLTGLLQKSPARGLFHYRWRTFRVLSLLVVQFVPAFSRHLATDHRITLAANSEECCLTPQPSKLYAVALPSRLLMAPDRALGRAHLAERKRDRVPVRGLLYRLVDPVASCGRDSSVTFAPCLASHSTRIAIYSHSSSSWSDPLELDEQHRPPLRLGDQSGSPRAATSKSGVSATNIAVDLGVYHGSKIPVPPRRFRGPRMGGSLPGRRSASHPATRILIRVLLPAALLTPVPRPLFRRLAIA